MLFKKKIYQITILYNRINTLNLLYIIIKIEIISLNFYFFFCNFYFQNNKNILLKYKID